MKAESLPEKHNLNTTYKKYCIGGLFIGHKESDNIEEIKEFMNEALTKASKNFKMLNDKITFIIRPDEFLGKTRTGKD